LEASLGYTAETLSQNIKKLAGHLWLTLVILATPEAEIKSIEVRSQLGQMVHETLSQKKNLHKKD
jgi:hypothetical protein